MSKDGSKDSAKIPAGRILLGIALLIALVAIGVSVFRNRAADPALPPAPTQTQAAPDVEQVITNLEKKLQKDPDDAEGWRMLGWSFFETNRYAESATAMKRATSLDPKNAEYWSMLGEALVLAGNGGQVPDDAKQAFQNALKNDPKDPRARYFLAVAKDISGDHEGAINDWFTLLKDTPSDAPYAADIRRVIAQVAEKEKIDVAQRLAATEPAAPTGGITTDGANVATAAIPGPSKSQMQQAAALPKGQQEAMIAGMVDGLAERLEKNPNDANGWIMLMRSRIQLGETAKAQQALKDATQAFRSNGSEAKRIRDAAKALGISGA